MTTPHVTAITSERRSLYSPAYQTSGIPALDAYRARCAELRELDRRADVARVPS